MNEGATGGADDEKAIYQRASERSTSVAIGGRYTSSGVIEGAMASAAEETAASRSMDKKAMGSAASEETRDGPVKSAVKKKATEPADGSADKTATSEVTGGQGDEKDTVGAAGEFFAILGSASHMITLFAVC